MIEGVVNLTDNSDPKNVVKLTENAKGDPKTVVKPTENTERDSKTVVKLTDEDDDFELVSMDEIIKHEE